MASVIPDDIDFSSYEAATDAQRRIVPASAFAADTVELFYGDDKRHGAMLPWSKTHSAIRFTPGAVTLWTGFNGAGKSLLLGQVAISLAAQGERILTISPEMAPARLMHRACRQAAGTDQPAVDFIHRFHAWTDRRLYLYNQLGMVEAKRICAVARFFADRFKGTHVIIDSLLKCRIPQDDFNAQHAFVNELTSIARDTGMHLHLVAHAKKNPGGDAAMPSRFDVRGSGTITDQVDMVLTVWRDKRAEAPSAESAEKPSTLLICDKNRHNAWEGKFGLWYHAASGQFCGDHRCRPMDLMQGGLD